MRAALLYFIMLCNFTCITAQVKDSIGLRENAVISSTETIPAIDILAQQFKKNYRSAEDQLLAIHSWVARNIIYDTDSMYLINWRLGENEAIAEALRRRRGVCQNYSTIFNALAHRCGIQSYVVDGFTMQHAKVDRTGHTWVAVNNNGQWSFCDPTWDKDDPASRRHFLIAPDIFIQTHMPFDPLWQLLPYEVTVSEFSNGNTSNKKNKPFINFKDSVKAYSLLNPTSQMEAAHSRMKKNAVASQLYRNQVAYVNMKLSIIYEEKDQANYNQAVGDFNEATKLFNNFLAYRNNGFTPPRTYKDIQADLEVVEKHLKTANVRITRIGELMTNDAIDPSVLRSRVETLQQKLNQEKLFLQNYFANNKTTQTP